MEQRNQQKLIERKSLVEDIVRGKKPKRVPLLANAWTWRYFDAGYKLSECLYDYRKMEDAILRFQAKYNFDLLVDVGGRNAIKVLSHFDAEIYHLDDEKGTLSYVDRDTMSAPEGMQAMIDKGFQKYIYEDMLPFKFHIRDHADGIRRYLDAAKEYYAFTNAVARIQRRLTEEHGVPALCYGRYDLPIELLFSGGMRGIRSLSMDMRRRGDLLEKMLLSMADQVEEPCLQAFNGFKNEEGMIFPVRITSLAHTIMNPKQYERFYWPQLKHFGELLEKYDFTAFMFCEGSVKNIYEYLQELPANRICMMIEQDDPVEFKKRLPHIALVGGFPSDLLANGATKECVQKADEMLEKVAYDGRWIYSQSKMLSFAKDCKPENLLAVNDFLRKYGVF